MTISTTNIIKGDHRADEVAVIQAIDKLSPRNVTRFVFTSDPYSTVDAVGLDKHGNAVVAFEVKVRQLQACGAIRRDGSLVLDEAKITRLAAFSAQHNGIPIYSVQFLPDRDQLVLHLVARHGTAVSYAVKTVSTHTSSYIKVSSAVKPLAHLPISQATLTLNDVGVLAVVQEIAAALVDKQRLARTARATARSQRAARHVA